MRGGSEFHHSEKFRVTGLLTDWWTPGSSSDMKGFLLPSAHSKVRRRLLVSDTLHAAVRRLHLASILVATV
jgi:hypothetical protein